MLIIIRSSGIPITKFTLPPQPTYPNARQKVFYLNPNLVNYIYVTRFLLHIHPTDDFFININHCSTLGSLLQKLPSHSSINHSCIIDIKMTNLHTFPIHL